MNNIYVILCHGFAVRGAQTPLDPTTQIPVEQIEQDLTDLAKVTDCVRTYSIENGLDQVPAVAAKVGIKVMQGIWLGSNRFKNLQQIAIAVRLAKDLAPFKPAWLEEPVPPENLKALEKVAAKVDIPVATGERIHDRIEFRELFESQAVDIIQPDVGHIGGILETRKLAATAETHYTLVAPHNVGGPVLTAASLQPCAAHSRARASSACAMASGERRVPSLRSGAADMGCACPKVELRPVEAPDEGRARH